MHLESRSVGRCLLSLALLALAGCGAQQWKELADDLANLTNVGNDAEASAASESTDVPDENGAGAPEADARGEVAAQEAAAPAGSVAGTNSTTVPPLFEGEPPFVFTYMPFGTQVTTTESAKLVPTPELPEPLPGVVVERVGEDLVVVRLEGIDEVLAQQRHKEWCWAACCEAVNKQELRQGFVTFEDELPTQEKLAGYFLGDEEVQQAPVATMMRAINLDLEVGVLAENGATLQVAGNLMTTDVLVEALLQGRVAILGLREDFGGHAVVAVGVTFGVVPGGATGEEVEQIGESVEQVDTALRKLGVRAKGTQRTGKRIAKAGGVAKELLARYAIAEVEYLDPLQPGETQRLTPAELEQKCTVIMSSELARKILTGDGFTAQENLGDELEDAAGE